MKKPITTIACSLLLFGCSVRESQAQTSSIGFAIGSSRDAVAKQLEQIHAKILKDKPELVHAEFSAPGLKRPMQVELGFADGKLNSVNYIPQAGDTNAPPNSVIKNFDAAAFDKMIVELGHSVAAKAPTADTASKTNWQYTTITNTSFKLDPRVATMLSEGWEFLGFDREPAWIGGANRPERTIVKLRKPSIAK